MSGEVSTRTRVMPPAEIRRTRMEQRLRRFFGLAGSQAPQWPEPSAPPSRGTPPEEPQPRIVISSLSLTMGAWPL